MNISEIKESEYGIRGLLSWYGFRPNSNALLIYSSIRGGDFERQAVNCAGEYLRGKSVFADVYDIDDFVDRIGAEFYDYIVLFRIIETPDGVTTIKRCTQLLKTSGKMLIFCDNKYGIKYLCGQMNPYTSSMYSVFSGDAINKFRLFSKKEIKNILQELKIYNYKFYSICPDLYLPETVTAEDFSPELSSNYCRESVSETLCDTAIVERLFFLKLFCELGSFHDVADSYLVEVSLEEEFDSTVFSKIQLPWNIDNDSICTSIYKDLNGNLMVKKNFVDAGSINDIISSNVELQQRGIRVVEGKQNGCSYVMPFIKAKIAKEFFVELLTDDKQCFFENFDKFIKVVSQMSDVVTDDNGELVLKKYYDIALDNCFVIDGEYVFFDIGRTENNVPLSYVFRRLIDQLQLKNYELKNELIEKYNAYSVKELSKDSISKRKNKEDNPFEYFQRRIYSINANQKKVELSNIEYREYCSPIEEGESVVIFGTGDYANRFYENCHKKYKIKKALDNNSNKWGMNFVDVRICNPNEIMVDDFVVVCIANYRPVLNQLVKMGVKNIRIYDPAFDLVNG